MEALLETSGKGARESSATNDLKTHVLIIGAGPYGIAVAHELWQRGIDFLIVGEPFALWLDHTLDSMRLRTGTRLSEVYSPNACHSLARFVAKSPCGEELEAGASRIPIETFRGYLRQVLEHSPFTVLRQKVTLLEACGGHYHARCSQGLEIEAQSVVLATGAGPHRYLPMALNRLPLHRTLHSWEARRIANLRHQRVLVIGDGQSAAEIVAHLRSSNRVCWSLRRRPVFCRTPLGLPKPLFELLLQVPNTLFRLPRGVRRRLFKGLCRTTMTPDCSEIYADDRVEKVWGDAEALGLRESAGKIVGTAGVHFDYVVAATGYQASLAGLSFLASDLLRSLWGNSRLDHDFQSSVPDLFMVGILAEATFGPSMRLIHGSRFTAQRLGAALTRRYS
ncbi:MAG: NAD(P)-binding domain-containing protein [Acidobacteriota bacterium]